MITGLRGVVLLDGDDARYLLRVLDQFVSVHASQGLAPNETLKAAKAKLAKAVASASDSGRNACVDVRLLGDQQDSPHTKPYDLLDTGEAASILGCTPANVRDLARRGSLRGHRAGGRWLYPAASVVARAERR